MKNYLKQIEYIKTLQKELVGNVSSNNKNKSAALEFKEGAYLFKIEGELNLDVNEYSFLFITDDLSLQIKAIAVNVETSVERKFVSHYTECKVFSFQNSNWNEYGLYRSFFYTSSKHLLFQVFGKASKIQLTVNHKPISIRQLDDYIVIENEAEIFYEDFSVISYNILVALGFVSGVFIQDAVFTFPRDNQDEMIVKYEKLRKGYKSIYHPFTANPFGYNHYLGKDTAEKIYQQNILKYLLPQQLSKLAQLSQENNEIQYALVLFNEANSSDTSLLIRNNCFFIVIEVLRKFFYKVFEAKLPKNYSNNKNMEKSKLVFECFMPVTDEDILLLQKRNDFMHGDIKDIEDAEMVIIMQRQLSFIYKIVFSYIGFDGHIIDHYAMRNNKIEQAFIKIDSVKN
ncbi:hypothetical protein [Parafilimonas terrae]|uniref:ApeA N-terminal domain-containing protein n=1 Tax=Parafilimonas terrae TaxID=1465490 RepID=A0A1I5VKK2_9BACT|nr:hypothetical protein [Parafilimonas terrae]SFQ07516.1 hypothetical protein SAMN05444277_10520 [Parafilimonas terrae]